MSEQESGQRTLVTFLLDRTGAAEGVCEQTINMFNDYLKALKGAGDAIEFTLVLFDSESFDCVYVSRPLLKVPNLKPKTYELRAPLPPRGRDGRKIVIPRIDAAYRAITTVVDILQRRNDKPKVVICIHIDGQEGSSTAHTWAELSELIADKTAQGWQFNFMSSGMDVHKQARKMGIPASRTQDYNRIRTRWMRELFLATAENAVAFVRGEAANTRYREYRENVIPGVRSDRPSVRLRPPRPAAKE